MPDTHGPGVSPAPPALAAACLLGTKSHLESDHGPVPGLSHNPWSEACSKRLPREPYCPEAMCPTCDAGAADQPDVTVRYEYGFRRLRDLATFPVESREVAQEVLDNEKKAGAHAVPCVMVRRVVVETAWEYVDGT